MQRVNVAYKNEDLLALLELQLEVEQINQDDLASISAERLKHFNSILKEQVFELQGEVMAVSSFFMMRHGIDPMHNDPDKMIHYFIMKLNQKIRETKEYCAGTERDLADCRDVKTLKQWLQDYPLKSERNDLFIEW